MTDFTDFDRATADQVLRLLRQSYSTLPLELLRRLGTEEGYLAWDDVSDQDRGAALSLDCWHLAEVHQCGVYLRRAGWAALAQMDADAALAAADAEAARVLALPAGDLAAELEAQGHDIEVDAADMRVAFEQAVAAAEAREAAHDR